MGYNFKKGYVFVYNMGSPSSSIAAITTMTSATLKCIGRIKADGGYTVKPDEKIADTGNSEQAVSQKLDIKLEVLDSFAPSTLVADLDGKSNHLLIVDAAYVPELDTINTGSYVTLQGLLTALGTTLPGGATGTLLAAARLHVEEDVKLGSGKVVPWILTGSKSLATKDELRKTVTLTNPA